MPSAAKPMSANKGLSRSQARLAAVQALYQMDLAETDLAEVIEEFKTHQLNPGGEGAAAGGDSEHFSRGPPRRVRLPRDIDPMIDQQLAIGWRLVRVDAILRAILRAGAFELIELTDVPVRVVINEYVEVAHAFLEGDESRVVNGVLDHIARKVRPGELPERS